MRGAASTGYAGSIRTVGGFVIREMFLRSRLARAPGDSPFKVTTLGRFLDAGSARSVSSIQIDGQDVFDNLQGPEPGIGSARPTWPGPDRASGNCLRHVRGSHRVSLEQASLQVRGPVGLVFPADRYHNRSRSHSGLKRGPARCARPSALTTITGSRSQSRLKIASHQSIC